MTPVTALDLFAGAGGWSLACLRLGIQEYGVEQMQAATATRTAAGFHTIHDNVWTLKPRKYDGLIASPPCQSFSMAGKGKGRAALDTIREAITSGEYKSLSALRQLADKVGDERTALVLTPLYHWFHTAPEWVAFEQVPTVLPVWEACADVMRASGYSVWVGNLHAEQYGVPQTRKRAFLLASSEREVGAPEPTHSKFHNRKPERLDEDVKPWVSMAEALGWGMTARSYPTVSPGVGQGGPDSLALGGSGARKIVYRERDEGRWFTHMGDVVNKNGCVRSVDQPAPTMTGSMDNGNFRWVQREAVIADVEPRVNNQSGTDFDLAWPMDRPAPTIAGRDIVTMPGANANRFNVATKSRNDGIRVSVQEAGVLQSFPADFPWQGSKSKQYPQVGNAVPVLLAEAALSVLH